MSGERTRTVARAAECAAAAVDVAAPPAKTLSERQSSRWPDAGHWWLRALDRRRVRVGDERWQVRVVGIHVETVNLWIQMESVDDPLRGLVLRVTTGTTLDGALTALERIPTPAAFPLVIDARPQSVRTPRPACD